MTRMLNAVSVAVTEPDTFGLELEVRDASRELSANLLAAIFLALDENTPKIMQAGKSYSRKDQSKKRELYT